jgi:hypothetical protein
MSGAPIEPMDPELASLLEAERTTAPPAGVLDRVWTRVAVTVPAAGPTGGHGAGGASGGAGTGGSWLASHAVGVAVATFAAGAATGAGVVSVMQRPVPERIVYVERAAPPAPVVAPVVTASAASVVPAATAPVPDVPPGARPTAAPSASSSLSVERGVLDDARAALSSGDAARALRLSDEHLRRFPKAQLGEEREALAIQSLVALGRYDEARARAARFRTAAPHSLLMPAIDSALESIP